MARQRKQPRIEQSAESSTAMMDIVRRVTRSQSRWLRAQAPPEQEPEAQATESEPVAQRTFLTTLVAHQELFFDRLVPFLPADSLVVVCEALGPHPAACDVLHNSQQWRYVAQRDGLQVQDTATPALMIRTVQCRSGCPQLTDYLSLRHQLESFDNNVVVLAGDLETITTVDGTAVDCLAFPTSSAFQNPGIGVAGCVHRRAGPRLNQKITRPPSRMRALPRGAVPRDVITTPGFDAGVQLLIHCVGPPGTAPDRQRALYKTYVAALREVELARDVNCAAFASISTGTLRYPLKEAAETAMAAVRDVLRSRAWPVATDKKIAFVCIDKNVLRAFTNARAHTRRTFCTTPPLFPDVLRAVAPSALLSAPP